MMRKSGFLALLAALLLYGAALANLPPVDPPVDPAGGTLPGGTIPLPPGFFVFLPLISK